LKYNFNTGYCTSCKNNLALFQGNCINVTPCASNQYRAANGACTNADPNCGQVNQTTGGCLTCKANY